MLNVPNQSDARSVELPTPQHSPGNIFRRFLRFGFLAWGGPVAQIDMIRNELVTQEHWVTPEHFRRLLAIYQVLPGPEAHELCVHFGMLAGGRWGGFLAGLGFMAPGFVLMFFLSWLYVSVGLTNSLFEAAFLGVQPAVIALIIRACHRIGRHCLVDLPLWVIATFAAWAEILHVSFWITLPLAGLGYLVATQRRGIATAALGIGFACSLAIISAGIARPGIVLDPPPVSAPGIERAAVVERASPPGLFVSGLRAGLLTFGGAYTAIPFLERDAVQKGAWMTQREFLDGVALSGILPAPLIIFSTFVGFLGGGAWGAIAMTLGVFLPAFSFSLLFHRHLETVVRNVRLRHFLEGVTAAVVGLIAVTAGRLALAAIHDWRAAAIAAVALAVLYAWKSRGAVPLIVFTAGAAGTWIFSWAVA
jgi:chromate transporter